MQLSANSRTVSEDQTERKTILLVDDERDLLTLLAQALEVRGFVVLSAATSEAALLVARSYSEPIDILVSDITLPGMSGIELAREISTIHPATATLLISGELVTPKQESQIHFLSKPFTIEELISNIRQILNPI